MPRNTRMALDAEEPLKVNLCDLRKETNKDDHHTSDYETTTATRLIVRRGQSFHVRLTFDRVRKYPNDVIRFELRTGISPRMTYKSRIILNHVEKKPGENVVGVRYSNVDSDVMDLELMTPVDMGFGQWELMMYSKRSHKSHISVLSNDIVMLFNPWLKGDQVYMENEKWRQEYVLKEVGKLYCGSKVHIFGMDWYFGQFEEEVLKVCLKLLDNLTYTNRGNAVELARHMSALVNEADDDGVLVGNWSGDYNGGKEPSDWVGSHAILKQYWDTGKPVKFGQCWVFSGVLCSVLRCLGIPARSVTNFESAHDTDGNLTIDYHYDKNGRSLDNDDSIWNFHVWNDVWMARPDLPKGYGGWQALDATPQEESKNIYRCGPIPLSSIKQGLIYMNYDGPFIYAEVNGTKRHWRVENDEHTLIGSDPSSVGCAISTKAVGSDERVDITDQYKFEEGSPEEMISFKTARKYAKFTKTEPIKEEELVAISARIPGKVSIGKDITATFVFKNVSKTPQEIFLAVVGKVMQYNGSIVAKIHDVDIKERILAGKSKEVTTTIPAKAYLSKVKNNNSSIKFFTLGGVPGADSTLKQTYVNHNSVELVKPVLEFKPSHATIQIGKTISVTASFKNPLSTALQPGVLRMEGSGSLGVMELKVATVKGNATFSTTFTITPRRVGEKKVVVGYASPSLSGVQGSMSLTVEKAK